MVMHGVESGLKLVMVVNARVATPFAPLPRGPTREPREREAPESLVAVPP